MTAAPPMTAAERRRVLVEWNDTALEYPRELCIHELFSAQARRTPDREALVSGHERLTYRDLAARAHRLSQRLRACGVGPETLVAIWMERSSLAVVAILGVLEAGGAYVPLDPDYPAERIAFMLSDCCPRVVLTQESLRSTLPETAAEVLCVDTNRAEVAEQPVDELQAGARPDDLAYVLYTSGSTGKPKGVAIEHRGPVALIFWALTTYDESELAGVLLSTSFCFDLSVFELFVPLSAGGKVILAQDALAFPALPAASEVTLVNTVPSAICELLYQGSIPSTVRTINLCGELLKRDVVDALYEKTDAERVYDLYGPTEDTVYSTFALRRPGGPQTIGRSIGNARAYVLDAQRAPVAPGTEGELYLAGDGLARGYLHRAELTAESFVPNPFDDVPGSRMYRTGDLVRHFPGGELEFLGRIDQQVKVRGYRIELGEVEACLEHHPGVRQAVVAVREDQDRKSLVGYWVNTEGRATSADELRAHLVRTLPEYMVPSHFLRLDALPLTANGKIDRAALPEPAPHGNERGTHVVSPRTPLQEFLVDIWRDILDTDDVGIEDNVLQLGVDSLQAARFVNRVQHELGEPLFHVTVFEHPTVSAYGSFLCQEYADTVADCFGVEDAAADAAAAGNGRKIDAAMMREFRSIVPTRAAPPIADREHARLRRAIFVLAPPRSGTTLLRVMLAGHPGLFAASELQLLGFDTLRRRRAAYSGKFSLWLEGCVRAVMELRHCDADMAKRIMQECEAADMTTQRFFEELQDWLGERTLVDKSPSYALDPATLRAAESYFEDPLFIHLVRHPAAVVRSFEEHHLDQVLYLKEHGFSARQLGELVWLLSHRNILQFLGSVPEQRQFRLRFEDLVRRPAEVMPELCDALGIGFHAQVLDPYAGVERKMVDGIYPESAPMGDSKFLQRGKIDAAIAERSFVSPEDDFLGEPTWDTACALGYVRPEAR